MSTLKPLIADIMVGQRIDDSLILAAHPDERMMPNGWEPSRTRRTLVLRFDGQRASFVEQFPEPLVRAWNSDNGSAYCTPVRGNYIYIFSDGKWQRESFSHDNEAVYYVWGWSGDGRGSDTVFVATDGALFVRSDGRWQRHFPAPLATRIYGMHGRDIKHIRACSNEGLLLWNGTDFEEADGPHDAVMKSILIRERDILAGEDDLRRWTEAQGWHRVTPVVRDITTLLRIGSRTFAGTFEQGVLEESEGSFVPVTPPFMCLALQRLGDGAFARGDRHGFVFDGMHWRQLELPACAAGQIPAT